MPPGTQPPTEYIHEFALNEDSGAGVWHRLNRTRDRLAQIAGDLLLGERVIDGDALEELETALLGTDVGVDATTQIVEAIAQRVSRKELSDVGALRRALREQLEEMLAPMTKPFRIDAARARGIDVVLADTAGRLQAKTNLMDELAKVKRIVARFDPAAPHEVILVLDAGIGQNALGQVARFDAAVGLTGLIVAKLDGSARAGILFAIAAQGAGPNAAERAAGNAAEKEALPVYFIGVGERVQDLRRFDAREFVDALLDNGPEHSPERSHG